MALAAVMLLPVMNYLRMHTRMPLVRTGMSIAIGFQILMILGSKSRGAAIALAITLGIFLLRSRNKIVYAVIGVIVVGAALKFMPESYFERLNTINNLDADDSFQGRVQAWKVATMIAFDKFPFGAGIYVPQTAAVYQSYLPGAKPHAAHSIYFQMLGENGFIGLGLYLGLLASGLYNTIVVMQQSRRNPQLRWAYDLANMTLVSLIGFYVGGAALSLAYYDGLLMMIALMSTLRALTAPATAANALRTEAARAQGPPRYAGPAAAPPGRGKPISARTP
jgi:probable O-glycosylation ligase (exosortase A-associated)